MSATVDILTVTHSISSLSISGVTVKDTHDVTDSMGLATAMLMPNLAGPFLTDVSIEYDESSQQYLRLNYSLHYRYYHCQIGGGLGGVFGPYSALLTNVIAIYLAFSGDATLSGALNNIYPTLDYVGGVQDLAGNDYHGADFTLRIVQLLEV